MTETTQCPICSKPPMIEDTIYKNELKFVCFHRCEGLAYFELENYFDSKESARIKWNEFIKGMKS